MSLATIRARLKSLIQTATSLTHTVYDYRRYSADLATYEKLFKTGILIHTWEIERQRVERNSHGGSGGVEDMINTIVVRGFYRVNDELASEKTFQDIVDSVCEDFVEDPTLNASAIIIQNPITADITQEMFAHVLCHKAEIILNIQDRRTF